MSDLVAISQNLAAVTETYKSRQDSTDSVLLDELGLRIRVEIHAHQRFPAGEMLVVYYKALEEGRKVGIGVTCVGIGEDTDHAIRESLANYAGNVIPVLAQWRTGHNCLVEVSEVELKGRSGPVRFEAIGGPLTCRGLPDPTEGRVVGLAGYVPRMAAELQNIPLSNALHWLECFAARQPTGEIDATCRLDNRDWRPGQRLLEADARIWPFVDVPMMSRRQFIMLVPKDPAFEEPQRPSLLARLFGSERK